MAVERRPGHRRPNSPNRIHRLPIKIRHGNVIKFLVKRDLHAHVRASKHKVVTRLEEETRIGKGGTLAAQLSRLDLIVLDELGYLPFARSGRSEEHTSELQYLMRNSYAVFILKNKKYH